MVYPQMPPLTDDEVETFLKQAPKAILCSTNEDGSIHAAPVWFTYGNGQILMGTQQGTRRVRNIKRNNNVTLVIDIDGPPPKGAVIYGKAELDYDNPLAKRIAIFEKYMPKDKAEYLAQSLASIWKLVIIYVKPERIASFDYGKDPTGIFARALAPAEAIAQ